MLLSLILISEGKQLVFTILRCCLDPLLDRSLGHSSLRQRLGDRSFGGRASLLPSFRFWCFLLARDICTHASEERAERLQEELDMQTYTLSLISTKPLSRFCEPHLLDLSVCWPPIQSLSWSLRTKHICLVSPASYCQRLLESGRASLVRASGLEVKIVSLSEGNPPRSTDQMLK